MKENNQPKAVAAVASQDDAPAFHVFTTPLRHPFAYIVDLSTVSSPNS